MSKNSIWRRILNFCWKLNIALVVQYGNIDQCCVLNLSTDLSDFILSRIRSRTGSDGQWKCMGTRDTALAASCTRMRSRWRVPSKNYKVAYGRNLASVKRHVLEINYICTRVRACVTPYTFLRPDQLVPVPGDHKQARNLYVAVTWRDDRDRDRIHGDDPRSVLHSTKPTEPASART